jgi:hypothetical protein
MQVSLGLLGSENSWRKQRAPTWHLNQWLFETGLWAMRVTDSMIGGFEDFPPPFGGWTDAQ